MDCVWLRIRHRDRLLHHAKGSIRPVPEDRLGRSQCRQVAGQHEFDSQQVLEQVQRHVGLADAQWRSRVVVLDAEIQRRSVQSGRCGQLLEFRKHCRGRVPQLQSVQSPRSAAVSICCMHPSQR